jgi:hypothetical protein
MNGAGSGGVHPIGGNEVPSLDELEALHRSLTREQQEELLECLLIAASKGRDAMMAALGPWLLSAAAQLLIEERHPCPDGE